MERWYYARPALVLVLMALTVSGAPVVETPWGTVQGVVQEGDGGRTMHAFRAIPYARPPVGDLRFEKPVPHPGLEKGEVFMADKIMPACPQVPFLIGKAREQSEDCLMLDIYTPVGDDGGAPRAVMIFIHGGGFTLGDAPSYRPSKLVVDGGVIVVTIQYRLGTFGFLSTGDGTVTPNAGLWDQNLAIRWVKNNIRPFGGDPDLITIFGESAGSMSVGLQMMSPQSRGLFRRGILQSGAPQGVALFSDAFDMKVVFKGLADMFECQGDTTRALVNCLKDQTTEDFFNKSAQYAATSPFSAYFFPLIDGIFIPKNLTELTQDKQYMKENGIDDIDVIIGLDSEEGAILLLQMVMMNQSKEVMYTSATFQQFTNICLMIKQFHKNAVMKKSVEFFYRGADAGSNVSETLDPVVNMYGDCLLNSDVFDWARKLAASSHSAARYMYVVDHDFAFNREGPVPGAHHGDELILEFDNSVIMAEDSLFHMLNKTEMAPEEVPLSDKFVQLLTSFAKTGNPSPVVKDALGGEDWPQFTAETEAYLSFSDSHKVVPRLGPFRDRVAFWVDQLPQLNALTTSLPVEEEEEAPGTAPQDTSEEQAAKEEL